MRLESLVKDIFDIFLLRKFRGMKKKILIFKNIKSQEEHDIQESMKLTPEERIAMVVELIKKIYPDMKPDTSKRIHFSK